MLSLADLQAEVGLLGDADKARGLARFFKTGKGEYGEGDFFAGLTVPQSRKLAAKYKDLELIELGRLLKSKIHEERLIALIILVERFKKADEKTQKSIYNFYLSHTKYINNWDLVDLSAEFIVGGWTRKNENKIGALKKLACSENVWERRISIISTFDFIKHGEYRLTLEIADILRNDKHDLIHKAVGWMLREVGKRCSERVEEEFLRTRYKTMPRTMLRYAIERMPAVKRSKYLKGEL